jgi:hypothetical protein
MFDQHNPYESRNQKDQWLLVMEPKNGSPVIISTKPVDYETARKMGFDMNVLRDIMGYGYKIVMVPVEEAEYVPPAPEPEEQPVPVPTLPEPVNPNQELHDKVELALQAVSDLLEEGHHGAETFCKLENLVMELMGKRPPYRDLAPTAHVCAGCGGLVSHGERRVHVLVHTDCIPKFNRKTTKPPKKRRK